MSSYHHQTRHKIYLSSYLCNCHYLIKLTNNPNLQFSNTTLWLLDISCAMILLLYKKMALLTFSSNVEWKILHTSMKDNKWVAAMKEKVYDFEQNQTWCLVSQLDYTNIIVQNGCTGLNTLILVLLIDVRVDWLQKDSLKFPEEILVNFFPCYQTYCNSTYYCSCYISKLIFKATGFEECFSSWLS